MNRVSPRSAGYASVLTVLGIVTVLAGLDLDLILAFRCLLEVSDAFAKSAPYLREFPRTEHHQDDDKDNNQFGHAKTEHGDSPLKKILAAVWHRPGKKSSKRAIDR
jgi:hypothetical protein